MKKIAALILISTIFCFAQNTNLTGTIFKKSPVGTIVGSTFMLLNTVTGEMQLRKIVPSDIQGLSTFIGSGFLPLTAGPTSPLTNSLFVPNSSGIFNTSGTSGVTLADGYILTSSNTDNYVIAVYNDAVLGNINSQAFDNNTFELSKIYQTPKGVTVSGTSTSFTGIRAGGVYRSNYTDLNYITLGDYRNLTVSGSSNIITLTGVNVTILGSGTNSQTIVGQYLTAGTGIVINGSVISATGSGTVTTVTGSGSAIATPITGGFNISVPSAITYSATGQGAATVTGSTSFNVDVSIPSITGVGSVAITGAYPAFTATGSGITTMTGTSSVLLTSIPGGYNISVSGSSSSGGLTSLTGLTINQHIGTIYNKRSWTTLADFTLGGLISASITGSNQIAIDGNNNGTLALVMSPIINERVKQTVQYIVGSIGAATYHIGPAIVSQGSVSTTVDAFCPIMTAAGSGLTTVRIASSAIPFSSGRLTGGTVTGVTGDVIEVSLEIDMGLIIAKSRNLTTNPSVVSIFTYDYATGGILTATPNASIYNIRQNVGTSTLVGWTITSNDRQRPLAEFLGDSKRAGVGATQAKGTSDVYLLNNIIKNKTGLTPLAQLGGSGDRSDQILATVTAQIAKNPQMIVFCPSSNDARNAVSFATWAANTKATINLITASGIPLYLENMIPESSVGGINLQPQSAWISTITGPNIVQVNTFDAMRLSPSSNFIVASLTGDGIHPNDAGYAVLANIYLKLGIFNSFMEYYADGSEFINSSIYPNNIWLGRSTGVANTTGQNQVFLGDFAGNANTTGLRNNFIGAYAGNSNTTGNDNNFIGYNSGNTNTTGNFNTYLGNGIGILNITGSNNTSIGYQSTDKMVGDDNSRFGYLAGQFNTGTGNCFFGKGAGQNAVPVSNAIFIGLNAGSSALATGIGIGVAAMTKATAAATGNIAIGTGGSLGAGFTGTNNFLSGFSTGIQLTSGSRNILLGNQTGFQFNSASDIVAVGYDVLSAQRNATLTGIVSIGNTSGQGETGNNKLHIATNGFYSLINGDFSTNTVGLSAIVLNGTFNIQNISTTGGNLQSGNTYFYSWSAITNNGESYNSSTASSGKVITTTGSAVNLAWSSVSGANFYRVYRGTVSGTYFMYYTTPGASFTDIGSNATFTGSPLTMNQAMGLISSPFATSICGNLMVGEVVNIRQGTNSSIANTSLTSGVVTVTTNKVTANSIIWVSRQNDGGTVSASYSITNRIPGTSFVIQGKDGTGSNQTADTSLVGWWIVEPK